MSIKKLFDNNKQAATVSKYLRSTAADTVGAGVESEEHLSQLVEKQKYFLPPVDYSNPLNFVRFGSAKQYYNNTFTYISSYYPYDGSGLEKTKFYNDLNPLEKYMLEEVYPASTGYISNGTTYGSLTPHASGYYSATNEYIQTKGGPHKDTLFDEEKNRTSNLTFGGTHGTTVEFFYKKTADLDAAVESPRQVVFDLWNGAGTGSAGYGRLRIEIATGSADHFEVTMLSGTAGFSNVSIPTGSISINDGTWRNYAFAFDTSQATPTLDFYINGDCTHTGLTGSGLISEVTGTMISNIGALRVAPSGTAGVLEGDGKFSGSLDEFRFWKKARNAEQIGQHWFSHVNGGSNKYDANISLGVYYKFNEGVTGDSNTDSVILDYSGRVSNGLYVGYSSASRNLGSAVDDLSIKSVREIPDPIIRTANPRYITAKDTYELSGSNYDAQNNARMINHLPAWVIEEEEAGSNELLKITQVMANYFDTLYNQAQGLKNARSVDYLSGSLTGSINEMPYSDRLVENLGIDTPELFENIDSLGQFLERDEQINFDNRLEDVKNVIYKNIYNNLAQILKSKGSEKSVRNFIRCLGVDDEIIALNTYTDNADYKLLDSYKTSTSTKKYADFTGLLQQSDDEATLYQYYDATNSNSVGLITGSVSNSLDQAVALQAEVVFPDKQNYLYLDYEMPSVVSSSLFGFHTPLDKSQTSTDLTWESAANDYGLEVYAVKAPGEYAEVYEPLKNVKDAYFIVKNRAGDTLLSSSIYTNVYENKKWNFTLSLRPQKYPFADSVSGSSAATNGYWLELYGVNYDSGVKQHSFAISSSYTPLSGSTVLSGAKRIYVGAHRTNYTGSTLVSTDIKASSIRYWTDYLPSTTLDLQAKSSDAFGRNNPYKNAYSFQTTVPSVFIPKIATLAMNWDLANVSESDASGRFNISDYSSGSTSGDYPSSYQGNLSPINLRQHTGRGDFFSANYTPVRKAYLQTEKLQPPEYAADDNMVRVLSANEETFGVYVRPQSFFFAVERSMYKGISDRILEMFASIDEFNNLIGEPVNKYRANYKKMEHVRELFFQKVQNDIPDLEKYVDYYKWLDSAIGTMIEQLLPASARYAKNTRKMIESHVLERPKIQYQASITRDRRPGRDNGRRGGPEGSLGGPEPLLGLEGDPNDPAIPARIPGGTIPESIPVEVSGGIERPRIPRPGGGVGRGITGRGSALRRGISQNIYTSGWRFNHRPVNGMESENAPYWQRRAERYDSPLAGPGENLYTRQATKKSLARSLAPEAIRVLRTDFPLNIGGGSNPAFNKKLSFQNFTFDQFKSLRDIDDIIIPGQRKRIAFRATMDGVNYTGEQIAPFSVFQSTLNTGYNAVLAAAGLTSQTITNFHHDNVMPSPRQGIPLQGPFTEQWVGGRQSRHVSPMRTEDRKEAFTLSVVSSTGSVNRVTPGSTPPGYYLRNSAAKAPVNISNIRTIVAGHSATSGVRQIGNYLKKYEVVQTADRSLTNMDFITNTSHYAYTMPTAFVTPPSRRSAGLTGSADYPAPRQIASRRTNQTIIVDRFSAPGGKQTSKQQFRDVNSDQYAPNNALPFRNLIVRQPYNQLLTAHVKWGGYSSLTDLPAPVQTQRNTRPRVEIGSTDPTLTYITGNVYDNAYVTHPIPSADRAQWTSYISGGDNLNTYNAYVVRGARYPDNIYFVTQSSDAYPAAPGFDASLIVGLDGSKEFKWANYRDFVPWKQLRSSQTAAGKYYSQNNVYELLPNISLTSDALLPSPVSNFYSNDTTTINTKTRMEYDRNNFGEPYYYSQQYREAPVTSRYKPLIHHVRTNIGTPTKTTSHKTHLNLEYSYGNALMGFANRQLNYELAGNVKFAYGKIKRPYEVIREKFVDQVDRAVTGIDLLKLTSYQETIHPKEIYTYLSGSRARQAFVNDFWKDDKLVVSTDMSAFANYSQVTGTVPISTYNRQYRRLVYPYKTSQDYSVMYQDQTPVSYLDPDASIAGFGQGSRWPLDSYLYADSRDSLVTVLTGGVPVLLADVGTMAAGELMMTHYGRVYDQATYNPYKTSPITAMYESAKTISAQYVYNVPSTYYTCSTTPAVCATSYIDALRWQNEPKTLGDTFIDIDEPPVPPAAATGSFVVQIVASRTSLNGESVTVQDLTTSIEFVFDETTGTTSYDGATNKYNVGLSGTFGGTVEQIRDTLLIALGDSVTTPTVPLSISVTDSGTDTINVTAWQLGSLMNAKVLSSTRVDSAGIVAAGFGGGADRADTLHNTTLALSSSAPIDFPATVYSFYFNSGSDLYDPMNIGYQSLTTTAQLANRISSSFESAYTSSALAIRPHIDPGTPSRVYFYQTSLDPTEWNRRTITGSCFYAESDTGGGYTQMIAGDAGPSFLDSTFNGTFWDYGKGVETLELNDVAHGLVTSTFHSSVAYTTVASSPSWLIGTLGADSTAKISQAIGDAITARQVAGDVNISVTSVVDPRVSLIADVCGTGMNGKAITGSAEASGFIYGPDFGGGTASVSSCQELVEPRSPGSVYTRPPWTAATSRKYVQGTDKGTYAGTVSPFYDNYETYVEDIRRVGKAYTILPEYRISEHIAEFKTNGSLTSLVKSSLELTGASESMFDGTNIDFYERYSETDKMEFLENFMPSDKQNRNYIFNKFPRHFEIKSDALLKILPYNGFYPVNRSLEIASLFHGAYSNHMTYDGANKTATSAWRSMLRPFFAPGILYNSIKAGVAVDYPIRRETWNNTQFLSSSNTTPLHGCLSGTLSSATPAGSIPGNSRRNNGTFDWSNSDVDAFFWADRLPFESIMDPASVMQSGSNLGTVLSDINHTLFLDVTGSLTTTPEDSFYQKSISNFLANIPKFFLTKKYNKLGEEGYLTKFVSQFGYPPKDSQQSTHPVRIVQVEDNAAYMMEVGLFKTSESNLYSNPYAFGMPTATGSSDWGDLNASYLPNGGALDWPQHRGEFAPYTPPYYYGPSLVRILFMPQGDKTDYTLEEILDNRRGELFIQYLNESGSYYDMTSGSYVDRDGNTVTSVATPTYGWNRAWQNRMDLDASISLYNKFPIDGGTYTPLDPNKWTIMPKWECPILDFPQTGSGATNYNFSSSVTPSEYLSETQGMWHQYGTIPNDNQGVYLYIKDIPTGDEEEYDYIAQSYIDYMGGGNTASNSIYVKKIPKVVIDSGREVQSLADLCGFDPDEVIRNGMDLTKAKRLGELGEDKEKTLSEAILALPFYLDEKNEAHLIPLRAPADKLGPQIKAFRKQFTRFSLPPTLASKLLGLLPPGYPHISDTINPFGGDNYDEILEGEKIVTTPAVYLLEHKVTLSRQDLADMWQGIMPSLGHNFTTSYAAIDHYLPGDNVEEDVTKFPEVLKKQIELGVERTGHPRYDIIDISRMPDKRGLFPDIKWVVFKVKERGLVDYSQMVMEEVDGPQALTYDNVRGYFSSQGLSGAQMDKLMGSRAKYSKDIYKIKHSLGEGSYNWPYDYFSLIELGKLDTKVVFRPELHREYEEAQNSGQVKLSIQNPEDASSPPSPAIFSAISKINDE
jgi:hypothetical protein